MALFNQDEADDFYAVMCVGSAALWALGGVPGALATAVIAVCGVGALANHKDDAPNRSSITIDEHFEQKLLEKGFGVLAVEKYRRHRMAGLEPQDACTEAVYETLQQRRSR